MRKNRIINKYFGIGFSVLSLFHSVSCSNEMEITGGADVPSANVEFVPLSLVIPVTDVPSTKSLTVEDLLQGENQINALYIEIFLRKYSDGSEEQIASYTLKGADLPQFSSRPDGNVGTLIQCPVEAYKMAPINKGQADGYVRVFANYSQAPGILANEDVLWNNDGTAKPLFMSGKGELTSDGGLVHNSKVNLTRQLAKIRVKLGVSEDAVPANLQIDYDHVKVQILYAANSSDPLESKDVSSTPDFAYIDYPERTGSALRMKKEGGRYKAGEVIDSCYIHENIRDSYDDGTTTSLLITIPTTDPVTGFKETHSQLIKIAGDDGYRLKRNHVYTLDLRLRSQKGIEVLQKLSDWDWMGVFNEEVDVTSYIYTSGPLLLTSLMRAGDIFFETDSPVSIDLSEIPSDMNINTKTVYEKEWEKNAGYIHFELTNLPANSFSFYVTIASGTLQRRIKVTYDSHS